VFAARVKELGKSFIYKRNKRGPKIDPCGTPCFILVQVDVYRLIDLVWINRMHNKFIHSFIIFHESIIGYKTLLDVELVKIVNTV
jgi:hypothetical protein